MTRSSSQQLAGPGPHLGEKLTHNSEQQFRQLLEDAAR
jgi:hypothetical protein